MNRSGPLLIRLLRTAVCTKCEQVPSLHMQGTASYFDISILYISCDTVREMHVLAEVCVQSFTASAISSQLWIRVLAYMRNLKWIFNSPIKQARALRFKGSTNSWVESSSAHTHTHTQAWIQKTGIWFKATLDFEWYNKTLTLRLFTLLWLFSLKRKTNPTEVWSASRSLTYCLCYSTHNYHPEDFI